MTKDFAISLMLFIFCTVPIQAADSLNDLTVLEKLTLTYNGEVSRFLNHMAYAGWTDEIVKAHSTEKMGKTYKSGDFLKFKKYGRLMGFKGIYKLEANANGAEVRAIAVFENQEIDVHMTIQRVGEKYLMDNLQMDIITPKEYSLDMPVC